VQIAGSKTYVGGRFFELCPRKVKFPTGVVIFGSLCSPVCAEGLDNRPG
jgi:hypothetical protein